MGEETVVAWKARFNHDEISAVQHAMDLKLTDEAAFWVEYQNEPLTEDLGTEEQLTLYGVSSRVNGHSRRSVPEINASDELKNKWRDEILNKPWKSSEVRIYQGAKGRFVATADETVMIGGEIDMKQIDAVSGNPIRR